MRAASVKCRLPVLLLFVFIIQHGSGKISNKIVKEVVNSRNADVWNEESCLSQGGICVRANECPSGKDAPPGLCPDQQHDGVECCYGLPTTETNCENRGGICRSKCSVVIAEATSCDSSQVCCALV